MRPRGPGETILVLAAQARSTKSATQCSNSNLLRDPRRISALSAFELPFNAEIAEMRREPQRKSINLRLHQVPRRLATIDRYFIMSSYRRHRNINAVSS